MYEEAKNCGAGGEGVSSRAHSIPHGIFDGDQYDQLYGARPVLKEKG
jgi:hypothetical protein